MMYDLPVEDSPVLKSLQINGHLTFMPGADRHLKAYNLWVRAGKLNIGEEGSPFVNNAQITLYGDNSEDYWAFTKMIEAGNKNLVITGDVNMYGVSRDMRTRLLRTAYAGTD